MEKNGKTPNFCLKSYFLRLNLYCTCSQLSFEVYNSSLAKDFIFFQFFFQFFQFFKILNSAVCSGKSMLLWGPLKKSDLFKINNNLIGLYDMTQIFEIFHQNPILKIIKILFTVDDITHSGASELGRQGRQY